MSGISNRNRHYLPIGAALLGAILAARSARADCGACAGQKQTLVGIAASEVQHKDVLAKNLAFLQTLPPGETSKAIKVKSNIVVIQLRLETMHNQTEQLNAAMATNQCGKCPP